MIRIKWPVALATLFVLLLGWYLLYTQQVLQRVQENSELLSRIYTEVQEGLVSRDPTSETQALLQLQRIVTGAGVPLVVMGPGDTVLTHINLPFEVDDQTVEGQQRIRAYVRRLDERHPPVGDLTGLQHIHYGDSADVRSLRLIPILQATGLLLTVFIGFLVIRYQRRAEGEKAWTAMARELAHQLGTPLSSLAGWLEVLRLPDAERPGDLSDYEIASSIGEDLERLERISHRFELIGTDPELESLSVRQVVGDLEEYLAARIPRLARKGVDLLVDIPHGLPRVKGNEVLLIWALENVVKNALDALAGRGGKITIYAREVGGNWVSLRIRDTGPGVDPEIRDKIFEPGVTSKVGGWGVGLALSRRIVEGVHKGKIELLETVEGTTFQIRLPAADA
ncbi:MAG: HAMP domain-containing sensor histidine kinase [Gemmatimonadetes bacterium]|nr:HAMP domain-containing sensor histidine kinase [Gemmatimonadota bacterium]MDA1103571.1 HAMP domain-containing sensor histidine kinase [Gemmatimonadota bacterium]